jgi:hypothetical protein
LGRADADPPQTGEQGARRQFVAGASNYRSREPEKSLLYETVQRAPQDVPGGDRTGWERFAPLRRGDFERYLRSGILANGFARVRCVDCGDELL